MMCRMLVGLGDLPQPDSDVLKMTLWENGPHGAAANAPPSTKHNGSPKKATHSNGSGNSSSQSVSSPSSRIKPDQLPPHLAAAAAAKANHSASTGTLSTTDSNNISDSHDNSCRSSVVGDDQESAHLRKRSRPNGAGETPDTVHANAATATR